MGTRDGLAVQLAEKICAALPRMAGTRLPAVRRMAEEYDVSVRTVREALAILAESGEIVLSPRRCARIVSKSGSRPQAAERGEDRFYEELRNEIIGGIYPKGHELPKIAYFSDRWHLSVYLIRKVLHRLISESLLHRRGNRIMVGSSPPPIVRTGNLSGGVILVCVPSPKTWEGLRASSLTGSFCVTFCNEASRHGVSLREVVYAGPGSKPHRPAHVLPEQIGREAKCLGPRYRGALVLGDAIGNSSGADSVGNVVDTCLGLKRPVAWLDRNDRAGPGYRIDKLFTRCRYDERAVAATAADYLHGLGHRCVAFLSTGSDQDSAWQTDRAVALSEAFAKLSPETEYHVWETPVGKTSPDWSLVMHEHIQQLWHSSSNPRVVKAMHWFVENRTWLRKRFPRCEKPALCAGPFAGYFGFRQALLDGHKVSEDEAVILENTHVLNSASALFPFLSGVVGPTAIIAPNYEIVQWYVTKWLTCLGLDIPASFSLLSFDYVDLGVLKGITTVDLGFGALGYQAFHAITRIAPIDRNRMSEIKVRPMIIDRGTCVPVPSGNLG